MLFRSIKCNASTQDTLDALASTNTPEATVLPSASADATATPEASAEASAAATYTTTYPDDPYNELVSSYDTTLTNKALWAKAQELGIDFKGNDDIKSKLLSYMGIEDDGTDATASADTTASPEATATPDTTASAEASASAAAN